jgi:hypothetical protein
MTEILLIPKPKLVGWGLRAVCAGADRKEKKTQNHIGS